MMRKGMHLFCAVLALSSVPANAATKIKASEDGRKGSTVVTPINDTIDDIMKAAADADGVAARTNTILDLETYPMVVDLAGVPAAPLAANGAVLPIAPIAVAGASDGLLAYLPLAALLFVPLALGGHGGSDSATPPITPPTGQPGGPDVGPPPGPLPAVPEPATWLMLLLGFGAIGATLRARPAASRRTLRAI